MNFLKTSLLSLFLLSANAYSDYVSLVNFEDAGGVRLVEETAIAGTIIMWGNGSPPEGWIILNGQSTDNYPNLKDIYGSNVPDMSGLFVRGFGGNSGNLGEIQESSLQTHSHTASFIGNALPPHSHSYTAQDGSTDEEGYAGVAAKNSRSNYTTSAVSAGTPSGNIYIDNYGGNEVRPQNTTLVFIVKAF